MMASTTRRIDPSNGEFQRLRRNPSAQDMLSKSLGTYSAALALDRHVSDVGVSSIAYAGYLLKRSNRPYQKVTPFPLATAATNPGGETSYPISHLSPRIQQDFPQDASFIRFSTEVQPHAHPQHVVATATATATTSIPMQVSNEKKENTCVITTLHLTQQYQQEERRYIPKHDQEDDQEEEEEDLLELSMQFAAGFFGIDLPPLPPVAEPIPLHTHTHLHSELPAPASTLQQPPDPSTPPRRSAPIKMTPPSNNKDTTPAAPANHHTDTNNTSSSFWYSGGSADGSTSSEPFTRHQHHARPEVQRSISDCSQPTDFVEAKDGHIWRAKYCMLEDGILYFYRHQADAESPEAQLERKQSATASTTTTELQQQQQQQQQHPSSSSPNLPLGYSPIPNRAAVTVNTETTTPVMWEKRVPLDCVGAVRSAELEYGPNSFELSAVEDEDNKLVLRAESAELMNEWLFQFHRSIATFVMEFMDHMPLLDIIPQQQPIVPRQPQQRQRQQSSPHRFSYAERSQLFFSPRFLQQSPHSPTLSHGHGRNSMHRRRWMEPSADSRGKLTTAPMRTTPDILPAVASSVPNTPHPLSLPRRPPPPSTNHQRTPPPPHQPVVTPQSPHFAVEESSASPELSAPQTACPETEHPEPSQKYVPPHVRQQQKYVPPHLRNQQKESAATKKYVPPHLRNKSASASSTGGGGGSCSNAYVPRHLRKSNNNNNKTTTSLEERAAALEAAGPSSLLRVEVSSTENGGVAEEDEDDNTNGTEHKIKLGGCADPTVIAGSIIDEQYKPRKASKVDKIRTDPFGHTSARWEIGAVSECGVRESNEDSYLVVSDVFQAYEEDLTATVWEEADQAGLFAIFDGHCGNHAARFAAEKLMEFIRAEVVVEGGGGGSQSQVVGTILERAISRLDQAFCDLCVDEGRAWESGATAVIATVVDQHLVVANLGDARAVLCRSMKGEEMEQTEALEGWNELPFDDHLGSRPCFWQDVTEAHSPNREDELARIQRANGWVTTETEIPIGQLKRMVLFDEDVVDILKRCFADRYQPSPKAAAPQRILQISRVCGELAVSRAIGDRDFKASYHGTADAPSEEIIWDCPLFLPYPDDHSRSFIGDLVTNQPDLQSYRVGEAGICDEFLLLACDGLWDVIDSDDAIRVTRDLLFEKGWPAKKAAARLAELAIHLGSSDNITVIVVRFFANTQH